MHQAQASALVILTTLTAASQCGLPLYPIYDSIFHLTLAPLAYPIYLIPSVTYYVLTVSQISPYYKLQEALNTYVLRKKKKC